MAAVRWDEGNLDANAAEAAANPRQKIDEPKTPFHYEGSALQAYEDSQKRADEGESPSYHEHTLQAGMHDLTKLSAAALERRERGPIADEDDGEGDGEESAEKRRKFDEARRAHYKTGSLAELRAQAASLDDEDEEEGEDEQSADASAPVTA
uniref:Protein phosphatase inhibitor 2 n=1 Tax=Calcidiscus leptoporus TaxID=127549 RepID=A0A7S0P2G2_9EUKA|mmetsp:Transcript_52200/g.120057  ORF Transcript_52200/g.120057 Transcript_52200/m.120057 type:complete len:152 (+) Transcript_52200:48-503(+)